MVSPRTELALSGYPSMLPNEEANESQDKGANDRGTDCYPCDSTAAKLGA